VALQLGALRTALLDAGASPDKADDAAEEVAAYENRLASIDNRMDRLEGRMTLLQWMMATNLVVTLGVLWRLLAH
jgi:hypothetical protein